MKPALAGAPVAMGVSPPIRAAWIETNSNYGWMNGVDVAAYPGGVD